VINQLPTNKNILPDQAVKISECYTKCNSISDQNHFGIMVMYRNIKDNRVYDDWTFIFLHSVLIVEMRVLILLYLF
jgi:hypothetical protein